MLYGEKNTSPYFLLLSSTLRVDQVIPSTLKVDYTIPSFPGTPPQFSSHLSVVLSSGHFCGELSYYRKSSALVPTLPMVLEIPFKLVKTFLFV